MRRNTVVFTVILILFAIAAGIVLPMDKGIIADRGVQLGLDLKGGVHMVYQADLSGVEATQRSAAMDSTIAVIQKRVDVFGVTEPVIQKQGEDRILVELPGISEVDKAKAVIGQTAVLEFGEITTDPNVTAKWTDDNGTKWIPATGTVNGQTKELTSAYFKDNTYVGANSTTGATELYFEWNSAGGELSGQITQRLMNQPLGIFFGDKPLLGDDGEPIAPYIRAQITQKGVIEGLSGTEAKVLSQLLNAGRMPVSLSPLYEQTVSPVLGADFVGMSLKAGIIGLILIMLFMIAYYRLPGLLASFALVIYATIVLAVFKMVPVTLSLAGIGGFVLSLGMAVDANILIFERMKEELMLGRTLGAAIEAGFKRAWSAIWDSNVTTMIACIVLIWLGSSIVASAPVMGFAITLLIGVIVSMFSAIVVTRTFLRLFIGTSIAQKVSLFTMYAGGK